MKFGIHNPSWLFGTDPAGIFDGREGEGAMGRGATASPGSR